jgi:hypothetical protein
MAKDVLRKVSSRDLAKPGMSFVANNHRVALVRLRVLKYCPGDIARLRRIREFTKNIAGWDASLPQHSNCLFDGRLLLVAGIVSWLVARWSTRAARWIVLTATTADFIIGLVLWLRHYPELSLVSHHA